MSQTGHRYVPAAGRTAFTRLYDPAMALTMRERTWRPRLQLMDGMGTLELISAVLVTSQDTREQLS
jgi:hypothetical protein